MPKFKRKSDSSQAESQKRPPQSCILHFVGIDHGPFTSLRAIRGDPNDNSTKFVTSNWLSHLVPHIEWQQCVVSSQTLLRDSHGHHRQCYQCFHLDLDRLKGYEASDQATISERHHSPCKYSSFEGRDIYTSPLFPPDCIFCDKVERKVHGKTERPVKFTSWQHKVSLATN